MTTPYVRRLMELKQMLADGLLRERILKIVVEKSSEPKGPAGAVACGHGGDACSQRFACKVLGLRKNTARYRPQRRARDAFPEALLREIYAHHPQLGPRKAKAILNRRLCPCVPSPKRQGVCMSLTTGRMPTMALKPREVWTWDFLADITTVGGTFRILALVNEYTKQCVGHYVARSINVQEVMRTLAQAISELGVPSHISPWTNSRAAHRASGPVS